MSQIYKLKILKKPDVTDLAGEKVMIDFESGKYYMLTGAANDIWDLLEDNASSDRIVEKLMDVYNIDEETCRNGVINFLKELERIGFIALDETV